MRGGAFAAGRPALAIVGPPNVGKSVIFHRLTGAYATVSNYPGTTVELRRGRARVGGRDVEVVDTPGMYGLASVTEEERVTARLLWEEAPAAVVQVADAKNLERMLPLTLQLLEAGLPLVLALNLIDEAERLRLAVDAAYLAATLGVPVVCCAAALGRGMDELRAAIAAVAGAAVAGAAPGATPDRAAVRVPRGPALQYGRGVEAAVNEVQRALPARLGLSGRAAALLLLQGDAEARGQVLRRGGRRALAAAEEAVAAARRLPAAAGPAELAYRVALVRQRLARRLARRAITGPALAAPPGPVAAQVRPPRPTGAPRRPNGTPRRPNGTPRRPNGTPRLPELLGALLMHPIAGLPALGAVLYLGLYLFVGRFAAGTLVDLLDGAFRTRLNPLIDAALASFIKWPLLRELFGGDYGMLTLGVRYAVAIVLPVVACFFFMFSLLEDCGYLPRLALLTDRVLKAFGLSGRSAIPITLGLGCDTMATIVSRTLETRRERVIATLLLALAVPCSAQLGVIVALLASRPLALLVWAACITAAFAGVGALAARLLPGAPPSFYIEVPPLRVPQPGNILVKTWARLRWYFWEVLPVFLLASVLIWAGRATGVFDRLAGSLGAVLAAAGLPPQLAPVFLFGFFRRDYGAAGLYDMRAALTQNQLVVAAVMLTLFIPCVAQLAVMVRERGLVVAAGIVLFVFPFALLCGFALNWALGALGVVL